MPISLHVTRLGSLHWGYLPALAALAVLHYLLSALALQAAAGTRLPLRQATLVQFTAAAANRVTPGGIGAMAVNTRYLVCRGLRGPQAIASVSALHAATMVADLGLALTVLTVAGPAVLPTHAPDAASWLLAAGAVAVVLALAIRPVRRRAWRMVGEVAIAIRALCRRPRDLMVTLLTCAGTTMTLSAAFAISVLAVPGAARPAAAPALVACYFIGTTAGGAVPIPAGIGTTEAAMIAALSGAEVDPGAAVAAVLLFRLITFWTPVPVGLVAARALRRSRPGRRRAPARIPFFTAPAPINPAPEA